MLGYRFLKINNTPIPNPYSGFKITFTPDETINTSEAGTELVRVRRLNKRTFTGTWQLTSFWLKKFENWSNQATVTVTYQGEDYTCRMRGFNPTLAQNSEYSSNTDGLWTVTPTFTEI